MMKAKLKAKQSTILYSLLFLIAAFFVYLAVIVFYPTPDNEVRITNIRMVLELFSFTSSFLLLAIAVFGLKQLHYAQKEIETTRDIFRTQSKRNSYEAAANECRNFSDNIMPLIHQLNEFTRENNITYFQDAKIEEVKAGFKIDMSATDPKQAVKFAEIQDVLTKYMNGMELFALYFVSRIADENIAFLTMGTLYVKEVERLAKLLPLTGTTPDDCKAIWPLYFSWKSRLQKQELEKERANIDKKLDGLTVTITKPIGTE